MSITAEEGRAYLLAAIEREKVTGSVQGTMEVADKLLIEIQVDHPDMKISEIADIIFPIVDELNS
tara:strand:+ start:284 stop:478 length:195 start_codon:yes stop_codon:yes gene_type:complete